MPLLIFPVRKSVRQIMSDSQRTEEERAHTKILKTERELFFRMKFSAGQRKNLRDLLFRHKF